MERPLVDVVIVAYNSRDDLVPCIRHLVGQPGISVIVVDNASPDRSYEAVEGMDGVVTLRQPRNGGFAYGCNAGWRAGRAPFVLFLNPDASMDQRNITVLVEYLRTHPTVGAVGPRIVDDDGELDYSIRAFPALRSTFAQALFLHRVFPRARWTDEVVRDPRAYEVSGPADWLSGACILARREALEMINGWDEGFFLYGEDMDICTRIWDSGWSVDFVADARCTHSGGASVPRARLLPVLAASRVRYAQRHRRPMPALLERIGIALGEVTHALVGRGGSSMRRGHAQAALAALRGRAPDLS